MRNLEFMATPTFNEYQNQLNEIFFHYAVVVGRSVPTIEVSEIAWIAPGAPL